MTSSGGIGKANVAEEFYSLLKNPLKRTNSIVPHSLEIVSVVVNSMSKNVLVCVCYRPPNAGIEFHQEFERFLKFANDSRYKDIIVLGDFNFPSVHWLNGSGFSDATIESRFTDYLQESGLFQLINVPTRGHNLIDLLLTTNEYFVHNITVTDDDLFV
jgi:hypothetical protein